MKIIFSKDQWTPVTATIHARIFDGKVWRKELHPALYGGYRIKYAPINSRVGQEWLKDWGHFYHGAKCRPDVVDAIDPDGSLRRSGFLAVQS